ncbi:MAG: chemotaxis protein CheA [Halobacteriovoraceae bacterium]|nr:chemotaxis protein CheA [Halobacteriovoraceae bacterium]
MIDSDDDFLNEIRNDFLAEAGDMVEQAEECFIGFEKNPNDTENMEHILRLFHSLKGSSFAVSFDNLANFSHKAEDFIIAIKNKEIQPNEQAVDTLLFCNDIIAKGIKTLKSGKDDSSVYEEALARLQQFSDNNELHIVKEVLPQPKKEDNRFDKTEMSDEDALRLIKEMQGESSQKEEEKKTQKIQEKESLKDVQKSNDSQKDVDNSIKVGMDKIDNLLDSLGEQIIWQKKMSYLLKGDVEKNKEEIFSVVHNLEKITYELQQNSMSLRMINLQTTFRRLERVARETSKNLSKKINFVKEGENNELDKTIVDSLINPLTHMIRNAIDHGLEENKDRLSIGKPEEGLVKLKAFRQGGFFFIEITDDGKGLDKEAIYQKAISKGIISKNDELNEGQIFNLIFTNGFSTKEVATDVSGRGVGMDVVKQMFHTLKGSCEIRSEKGKGTTFSVKLPLALAMFQGIILKVSDKQFIMPNSDFRETGEVRISEIQETNKSKQVIKYKNTVMPVISLREKFKLGTYNGEQRCLGAVVPFENKEYILLFDDLISQERIVLKKLLPNVESINGIVGGTILGDGNVALVLETREIIENYKLGA